MSQLFLAKDNPPR